ncbi:MAG: CapA family protein [Candidatus Margulisbacteria bacterium]|nr:CapA family protein [Candidatus Margulisiibacteriota bacterium]
MKIKRKYITLVIFAALLLFLFYKLLVVDVPMLYVTGAGSPWRDINEEALQDIASGRKTLIVLRRWQQKNTEAGDLIVAEDLAELKLFLRDKPDALAYLPWFCAEPDLRILRYFGVYFWDAEYYPLAARKFVRGLPRYRRKAVRNITLGGEVLLSSGAGNIIDRTSDVNYPWRRVGRILRKADLTIVRLGAPLVFDYVKPRRPGLIYGRAAYAGGLTYAGVDAAALAGSHIGDAGATGIRDTLEALNSRRIVPLGIAQSPELAYTPSLFRLGGFSVAVLAGGLGAEKYTDTDLKGKALTYYASADPERLVLAAAAATADVTLVLGTARPPAPSVYAVDGLGSLIFDSAGKEGVIKRYFFYKKRLVAVDSLPVFLNDRWYTEIK